ncbi:PucR family transcriptional regulator [Microbacterium hydrocarbonoxydans]|uniref:PucR family transcriptional regulator n=1 Tax=Microbacterium hydrocarbonoxydans TaxID=273678 RepID=UPI0013DB82C0|nr:helix-turn-helix domain-containing protein [Microbacterium hydrocarbonoxydans]
MPTLKSPAPAPSAPERALTLQMELTAILARGKGVDRLLRGWHQHTGEGVAVFDRLGTPLGRSDGFTDPDLDVAKSALGTHPPKLGESLAIDIEGEPQAILLTPFAGNATVRGFLARRITGEPVADLAAPALRALLALEYERHWLMDEPARRHRDQQFTRLLELDDDADATALLRAAGAPERTLRGLVVEARDETHAEVLIDDLAAMFSTAFVRHRGRIVECLVAGDPLATLADYGLHVPIGMGTAMAPQHAARSIRQARLALDTSRRLGTPMEYRDGAAHDLLLQIASPEYLEAFAAAALGPIERTKGGDALLETLHLWFLERRSIEATADRMQVHRHTIRNRIQRIAQLTGHDLDSIDTQTELWLALKARGFEPVATASP